MGSGGRHTRWKLSSLYHRSPATTPGSTPPRTPPPAAPPGEFVCPISGRLMADPVILPSGHTFERSCVQACKDLGVATPGAGAGAAVDHLFLIPNMALKAAIHNWCDSVGLDHPQPVDRATALHLVHGLLAPYSSSASSSPPPSSASIRTAGEVAEKSAIEGKEKLRSPVNPPLQIICPSPPSPSSPSTASHFTTTGATSAFTSSSSSSSDTFSCDPNSPPKATTSAGSSSPVEEEILTRLGDPQISEQEAALLRLRSATRDGGGDTRAALCTPRILAALRPMLLSRYPSLQTHATASLVNLSLHPPNRVPVVRAGLVPGLVDALKGGHPDAQDHAAGALFSLAVNDDNKAAVGALGALLPLLHLFTRPSGSERARWDAAMALYHLSMVGTNCSKLVKLGAVKTLLGIATKAAPESPTTQEMAMMILCNLAASSEGRAAMMEAGAVEAMVGLLRTPPLAAPGRDAAAEARREHCVAALYWMSRGSMRFRGLAKAAGAEEVLRALAEQEDASTEGEKGKRWRVREMARRALRGAEGSEDGVGEAAAYGSVSVLSEPAIRGRRRKADVHGVNSTKF